MNNSTLISKSKYEQQIPFNILVTGATGFIGSRLVKKLNQSGYTVKALSRKIFSNSKQVKYEQTDVFNLDKLTKSLQGVEIAFYLLHSMEGDKKHWKEFAARERLQAQNFLKAASKVGVKRIIYLGGLVNESLELSPHMKSRLDVGKILASGNIPVTELRASIIIGAKGGSFTMLQYLVERLGVMICPKWVKSLAQPIAVDDVIEYLVKSLEISETSGTIFEIGGPEKLTYEQLMRQYAKFLNKSLIIIEIPFLTPRLSSYWVDLITPVKASLARPLIDSLVHDTIVKDDSIRKFVSFPLKSVKESFEIATTEKELYQPKQKPGSIFRTRHRRACHKHARTRHRHSQHT